jgi:hypothetical protein
VRKEGIALEDHSNAPLARREVIDGLAIDNDAAAGRPHRAVVGHLQVLEGVDHPPLEVPALGRPDGGIHEPFAAADGMEEELGGGEAALVAVLDEAVGRFGLLLVRLTRSWI